MKIEIAKIPESGMVVEEDEPPQIMGVRLEGVEYNRPIHVRVSVNLVGKTLVVQGKLTTTAVLECNRCLKRFDCGVDVEDYLFSREVKFGETVDLTESIREDIIITLPMKWLCSPDCRGLCPVCGQDLNVLNCNCAKSHDLGFSLGLDGLK